MNTVKLTRIKKQKEIKKAVNVCPVCHAEFEQDENTCYMINKKYTCSWKCFSNYVKEHQKSKDSQDKPKRGRPRKNVTE